jgi:hypothetical protein
MRLVADDAKPRESGTRRAARSKVDGLGGEERERDSERPTLPIPRPGRVVGHLVSRLGVDRAAVDVSPTEGTLGDLVAMLEPPRPFEALPVVEELSFDARPTLPSIVLPIALRPEPAPAEAPGHRFKKTRRDRVMARARWHAKVDNRARLVRRRSTASPVQRTPPLRGGQQASSPSARSLRGAHGLNRSRRYIAAATAMLGVMALMATIGRSGFLAGLPLAADELGASDALPGGSAVQSAASAQLEVEPTRDELTVPVIEFLAAPSDSSATPASSGRPPGPAPAVPQKSSRPPSKRSSDVDFGI